MKRVHTLISGEVQGVGYREEVKRLAFGLNIRGWITNLKDGRVEITAEGEDKDIEEFIEHINIRKYPIFVEEIKVEEASYKGEFGSFRVIRDKDLQKEILSAISRGTVEIHEMKEVLLGVNEDTSAMLGKQDSMLGKQDSMLEKQDSMLEKQDSLLRATEKGFNDMRTGFREIKEEIHLVRDDFREMFMHEVNKLRGEIAEIKATLARMQEAD